MVVPVAASHRCSVASDSAAEPEKHSSSDEKSAPANPSKPISPAKMVGLPENRVMRSRPIASSTAAGW